jgi:hypothetical protein
MSFGGMTVRKTRLRRRIITRRDPPAVPAECRQIVRSSLASLVGIMAALFVPDAPTTEMPA